MAKSYGAKSQTKNASEPERHIEEIRILGYSVLKDVLPEAELVECRERLDAVYEKQSIEFGEESLRKINDLNVARALLVYDEFFIKLLDQPDIVPYLQHFLGDYYLLHLQNGIINRPNEEHHQSSWHRDLPYQNFVISTPLAISVFYCLDPFSEETGGTYFLPYSHRLDLIPSLEYVEKFQVSSNAEPGSVIIFDSMLFHRAGRNISNIIRRGINNVFVSPILKQQINLPGMLNGKFSDDPSLAKLLGYSSDVPLSVKAYRSNRLNKQS